MSIDTSKVIQFPATDEKNVASDITAVSTKNTDVVIAVPVDESVEKNAVSNIIKDKNKDTEISVKDKDKDIEIVVRSEKKDTGTIVVNDGEVVEVVEGNLKFKIENFEGPLDLLLHLIKKSKLDIEEVKLSEITEQYLEVMSQIESVDLEVASEFIEVAATLIEIKSKALLPSITLLDTEEEDSEALLLQRLNEYKLIKESAERLKEIENVDRFYKKPEPEAGKFRIIIKDMQLEMLLNAFTGLLHKVTETEKKQEPKEVMKEVFTVANKIIAIKDALIIKDSVRFSELFEKGSTRGEIITTFLALLEMLKLQEIKVSQNDSFNEIEIIKAEEISG